MNMQTSPMKTLQRSGLACLFSFMLAGIGQADTILADSFDTNSGGINNRAVETPQTAGDLWSPGDGDGNVVGGYLTLGSTFAKAGAAFDDALLSGSVESYTLSYNWSIDDSLQTDTSSFFYGGIGDSTGDGAPFEDFNLAVGFRLAGDFTGTNVTLKAGLGSNPSDFVNNAFTRANDSTDWSADLSLTYTLATGNVEFFVNGGSLGSVTHSGDIGGVWFKSDQVSGSSEFRVDNVLLTSTIPEPSSLALLMVGMAALIAKRVKSL